MHRHPTSIRLSGAALEALDRRAAALVLSRSATLEVLLTGCTAARLRSRRPTGATTPRSTPASETREALVLLRAAHALLADAAAGALPAETVAAIRATAEAALRRIAGAADGGATVAVPLDLHTGSRPGADALGPAADLLGGGRGDP